MTNLIDAEALKKETTSSNDKNTLKKILNLARKHLWKSMGMQATISEKKDAKQWDLQETAFPTSNSDVDGKENKKESFSLRNRTKDSGTESGTKQLANQITYFTAVIGFSAITIQAE